MVLHTGYRWKWHAALTAFFPLWIFIYRSLCITHFSIFSVNFLNPGGFRPPKDTTAHWHFLKEKKQQTNKKINDLLALTRWNIILFYLLLLFFFFFSFLFFELCDSFPLFEDALELIRKWTFVKIIDTAILCKYFVLPWHSRWLHP